MKGLVDAPIMLVQHVCTLCPVYFSFLHCWPLIELTACEVFMLLCSVAFLSATVEHQMKVMHAVLKAVYCVS